MARDIHSPRNVKSWTDYLLGANDLSLLIRGTSILPGRELEELYMKFIEYWSQETVSK